MATEGKSRTLSPDDLKVMRDRFRRASEHEEPQRKAILEAKNFRALRQWPDHILTERQGQAAIAGQPAKPPRPAITLDRISQGVQHVSNTIRAANFQIEVKPNGSGADKETADLFKGLMRAIQNKARSEQPIEWAADQAAEGGIGWIRLRSDYCDSDTDDQELVLERVPNNLSVYCDPLASSPTRADAKWLIVTEDIAKDDAKECYHLTDADLQGLEDFSATGDTGQIWNGTDTLRVVEYWTVEEESDSLYRHKETGEIVRGSHLKELHGDKPDEAVYEHRRKVTRPVVRCDKCIATKCLESYTWAGRRIPYFPVLGKELNVDGRIILMGLIQPKIEPQRMVNYTYTAAVEASAHASKAPWLVAAGQIENYKTIWQSANTDAHSYLPYDPIALNGTAIGPPARISSDVDISALVQLNRMAEEGLQATDGMFDAGMGNSNPNERSGEAIRALQKQTEMGLSHWLDNTSRALIAIGDEMVATIPIYYDRPGRILHILGIDDEPQAVMLGQPFRLHEGQPVPAGPPGAPLPQQQPPTVNGQAPKLAEGFAQFYDLKKGKYAITVSVGKGQATRRQEGVEALGVLAGAAPELVPRFADIWVGEMDFPGAADVAARLKPPDVAGKDLPPQIQAQLSALATENQALKAAIQTKQVEAAAKFKEAQLDAMTKVQIERETNASKERIALIGQVGQLSATDAKVDAENTRSMVDALIGRVGKMFDAKMEVFNKLHERVSQHADQAHDAAMTVHEHAHDAAMADLQRQTLDSVPEGAQDSGQSA